MITIAYIFPAWSHYAFFAMFVLLSIYAIKDTSRRKRLLSIGEPSDPSESELLTTLSTLNGESDGRLFEVSRHSVVNFRGHRLVLIWGNIGGLSTNRGGVIWTFAKHLYALGLAPDRDWLCMQTDVLKETVRGKDCSVYWIKHPKLLEKDIKSFQQSVPGYPPQGVGSPEP